MPVNHFGATGHLAQESGSFEPQRSPNFSLEIAGLGGNGDELISLALVSFPLPTEGNEEIEMRYGNESVFIAGKATFEAGTLVLRDFVDKDVRAVILQWREFVYNAKNGSIGRAKDYKKSASVVMTGPDGKSTRICKLIGVWPQQVTGGQLDMGSSDPVQFETTLRYDKAIWERSGKAA